jgi:hypothetical protein
MSTRTLHLKRNRDGTLTLRVGRAVEHVSGDKSKAELFDIVRYAAYSKGVHLDDIEVIELLHRVQA